MSDKEANDSGPKGAGIQEGAGRADVAVEVARKPKGPLPGEIRGLHKDKLIKRPSSTRSGGPRTAAGRARAAENSLKHGAYIAQPRQSDVYHEKLSGVVQELKPLGEIAMTLCQDVAHELAKMQTLNAYERDQIYRAEHDGVSLMELSRRLDFPWAETHLDVLGTLHAQGVLRAQLLRAWRVLAKPPGAKGSGQGGGTKSGAKPPRSLVTLPDQRVAQLYVRACELLALPGLSDFMHEHFFQEMDVVMLEARQGLSYLGRRISERGQASALVAYWLLRNQGRILDAVNDLKNERTVAVLTDERMSRAKSSVQRGLRDSLTSIKTARELKEGPWD